MQSKFKVLMVAAVLVLAAEAFLVNCGGDEKEYIEILSPEELSFVACAKGLAAPARRVTFKAKCNEYFTEFTVPYMVFVFATDAGWRYPLRDFFYTCIPRNAEPGAYAGELKIIELDLSGQMGGCRNTDSSKLEASIPVQVQVVDPGSDPFPGFTGNGADVKCFYFPVPVGTPGMTTQTLEIVNQGGGTLTWTLATDQPWLSLDPYEGETTAEQDIVSVNVDAGGFEAGSILFGTITVDSNSPDLPTEEVAVVLQVTAP